MSSPELSKSPTPTNTPTPHPRVSIIIVSWNTRELLRACLASLAVHEPHAEVIVVDNASHDGTTDMIEKDFPHVVFLPLQENVGFAKANNIALAKAIGEYIFYLNPDTQLTEPVTEKLIVRLQATHATIIGPQLRNTNGTLQASVRRLPGFFALATMMLGLHRMLLALGIPAIKKYYAKDFDYTQEQEVEQLMGAAMLLSRTSAQQLKGFDERYRIWMEEVDLCARIRATGGKVWYTPTTSLIHHGGASFAQATKLSKQRTMNASIVAYARKHFTWWQTTLLLLLIPCSWLQAMTVQVLGLGKTKARPQ